MPRRNSSQRRKAKTILRLPDSVRVTRRQGPDTYQEGILAVSSIGGQVNQPKSPTISRRC